jgi:hypothetical protein
MIEPAEQPEPHFPRRDINDIVGTKFNLWTAGFFCFMCALFVIFHAVDARKSGSTIWPLTTLECGLAILLPGAVAFGTYRQMKKLILASDASPEVMRRIESWGARGTVMAYMALMMVLLGTLLH